MKVQTVVRFSGVAVICGLFAGCIPYAVGSTARPARQGFTQQTITTYVLPHTLALQKSPDAGTKVGVDLEVRRGVSLNSDVGLRIASGSGVVVSYKRRLDGLTDKRGPGVALQVGAGAVDYGSHGEVEATLIASGGEEGSFTPYGGIRGVRTFLINSDAFPDAPVFGGFAGFRLRTSGFGISAEVGVFRDSHQYATFGRDIVVVPSISFHGDVLGVIARIQDRMRRP